MMSIASLKAGKSGTLSSFFSLFAVLTCLTSSSFASAYSDARDFEERQTDVATVAQKLTTGGLVPPSSTSTMTYGVRILTSGEVRAFRGTRSWTIAQLMPPQMRQLVTQIRSLRYTELIDSDLGRPPCADAPETTYTVHMEESSTELKIAARIYCHQLRLRNNEGQQIQTLLDQLDELAAAPYRGSLNEMN